MLEPSPDPLASARSAAAEDRGPESESGRRLRIAIVSEVSLGAIDGVVTRLMRTLEELGRAGDEVLLVAPDGGPTQYAGVEIVGMPAVRLPLYPDGRGYPPKRVSLPTRRLDEVLRRFRPDVIHAINPVLLGLSAAAAARRQGVPLVASYHAHLPAYTRFYRIGFMESVGWSYLRSVHNRAQLNLCTSMATGEQLVSHGFERVQLWPYGIDLERFNPARASASWRRRLSGGRDGRLVMLYVGRLAREKRVDRLLEAVRTEGVTLAIVGDGPERAQLERTFAGTPTEFLGFLTGDDLGAVYASADLFLLPSDTETLGLVTLEAQASGLPVIAAQSPASRELVADRQAGLLFDPARPGSLAAAVREVVVDPDRRAAFAERALRASQGRTWRAATGVLRRYYLECVLASPPRDPGASRGEARPQGAGAEQSPVQDPAQPPVSTPLRIAIAGTVALLITAWLMSRLRAVEGTGGLWLLNLVLSVPIATVAVCCAALGGAALLARRPRPDGAPRRLRGLAGGLVLAGVVAIVPPLAGHAIGVNGWLRVVAGGLLILCSAASLRSRRLAVGAIGDRAAERLHG